MQSKKVTPQRLGGLAQAAQHDPLVYTSRARQVFKEKFLDDVDPDGSLRKKNPKEAARRAEAARKLFYARIAYESVKARAAKKTNRHRGQAVAIVKKEVKHRAITTASTSRR